MALSKKDNVIQTMLADTILALCKNTLQYEEEVCVEGLLGITIDKKHILLVHMNETIFKDGGKTSSVQRKINGKEDMSTEKSSEDSDSDSPKLPRKRRRRRKIKEVGANIGVDADIEHAELGNADNVESFVTENGKSELQDQDKEVCHVKQEVDDADNMNTNIDKQLEDLAAQFSTQPTSLPSISTTEPTPGGSNEDTLHSFTESEIDGEKNRVLNIHEDDEAGEVDDGWDDDDDDDGGGDDYDDDDDDDDDGDDDDDDYSNKAVYDDDNERRNSEDQHEGDDSQYHCHICPKTFKSQSHLKSHIISHSDERQFACQFCEKTFKHKSAMRLHVKRIHEGDDTPVKRPFECEVCHTWHPSKSVLEIHMRIHTGEKPYMCPECGKMFRHSNAMKLHVKRIHQKIRPLPREKNIMCEFCDKTFSYRGHYESHKRIHFEARPFKCEVCDKAFRHKCAMKLHTARIHYPQTITPKEKNIQCKICDKMFSTPAAYKSHERIHIDEKPFKCNDCGREFRHKCALNKHYNSFHNPDPKVVPKEECICNVCGKSFANMAYLKSHMRTHSGEKPYHCEFCDGVYALPSILRGHQERIHGLELEYISGEGPFKCEVCHLQFAEKGYAFQHLRQHKEEKSYKCTECDLDYTMLIYLKRHQEKKHNFTPKGKVFTCDVCGEFFHHMSNLLLHQNHTHNNKEQKIECNACGKTFLKETYMKSHIKSVHLGQLKYKCSVCDMRYKDIRRFEKHMKSIHPEQTGDVWKTETVP